MADLSKDVLAFSEELKRMCRAYPECEGCPAYSELPCDLWNVTPELIKIVQKWSDEHPLKTYAQDFREKFPKCRWIDDENRPHGACRNIFYFGNLGMECPREYNSCTECWNEPMPEEETS